jgi:hypothetical protein
VTRSLGNGTLRVELGTGSWSARWPDARVVAGPFHASVEVDGLGFSTLDTPGTWNVSAGSAFGRAGAWARWTARDGGIWLRLHLPVDGALLVVEGGIRSAPDATPGSLVLAAGPFRVGAGDAGRGDPGESETELVRRVRVEDATTWVALDALAAAGVTGREALVVSMAPGVGAAFGIQALHGAEPVGTAITVTGATTGEPDPEVRVGVLDPDAGRTRGDGVRSEAVAFGAGPDPDVLAADLAALASRSAG